MESIELCNNASDVARELRQSWDDRMDYPPTKIPKRHLRGDLAVLIELSFEFRSERFTCAASVTQKLPSKISVKSLNQARGADDDQFTVLVGNVHIVDDQQRIKNGIDSVIRLKFSDEFQGISASHSLYLSFVSGEFVFRGWPNFKDGEFDVPEVRRGAVGVIREFPDDVIQARSKMMNDFPGKGAESQRDSQRSMIIESLQNVLVVELWNDGALAFLKESGHLRLKIDDVLVGPF